MKNLFLTLSVFTLTLGACSDDDNNSQNNPSAPASELKLITGSNTSGKVSFTNLLETSPTVKSLTVSGLDSDGTYYDSTNDQLIVASRTNNRLELYTGLKNAIANNTDNLTLQFFSTSDFNNAREIAVVGDKVIVTQDQSAANGNVNKLVVYQKTATGFQLLNSYTVDFKVWGIHVEGTTFYAVADLTSDIVVFNNFFANSNGAITPSKRVTIEGLVRTHGITVSTLDNRMVLTDVGSAASDTDGGVIVINNFSSVLGSTANLGTIALSSQVRLYGPNSKLGNPVDVAYDNVTKNIYVAERLNAGGQLLVFANPSSNGDATPISSRAELGVASVFLIRK
ncbi:hypothetical protein [Flavobacterium terrae]|uniref:Uncharacterized protein n=1 Tax=Flavobacterium terrae TaxID=415425 RepID=A0A1M6ECI2_9FLAO|nr:hypothetical protein [Flavobacterium terrae]SHI83018.1 hypothetical protein SAMN05444363_1700 [Flavobacterium terrae]